MKLFRRLREIYQVIGIYPTLDENFKIKAKSVYVWIMMISYLVSTTSFLLYEAADVSEMADSFFQALTAFGISVQFLIQFCKTPSVLNLLNKFNEYIDKRKLRRKLSLPFYQNISAVS